MSKHTITLKEEGAGEPASITIEYSSLDDLIKGLESLATMLKWCSFKLVVEVLSNALSVHATSGKSGNDIP